MLKEGLKENDVELGERGEHHNLVDILFVIDTTSSMSWCIKELKKTVLKIIDKFHSKQYNIKFAFQLYRDHPPQEYSYVEKHFDLMNYEEAIQVIEKQCDIGGGGDLPEAVMDGLYHGLGKTSWRDGFDGKTISKRFLFHGCDAPPHGHEYSKGSADAQWRKNGCPCGIKRQDIKKLLDQKKVDYSLVKCGKECEMMEKLFIECFEDKFKRVMEIERGNNQHKYSGSQCSEDSDEMQCQSPAACLDMMQGQLLQCEQEVFRPRKHVKKMKERKLRKQSEDDEEEEKVKDKKTMKRKRSMASLVCSEVESGCEDMFGQ